MIANDYSTYPETIKLFNRYKEDVHLEKVKDNIYKLITEDPYMRCGYFPDVHDVMEYEKQEEKQYSFVDPSGGPFISVGEHIYTEDDKKMLIIDITSRKGIPHFHIKLQHIQ